MPTRREFIVTSSQATLVAGVSHAFPAFAQPADDAWRRLDEYVNRRLRELNAPGLTLALADRKGTIRVATYGFADLTAKRSVSPSDLFQIGSISKSFCSICILQLADEGKLDLHKPLRSYLPWFEVSSAEPITAHHLLSHTSGLPDDVPLFPRGAFNGALWSGYAPGSHYSYSNTGYEILGMLLEQIEGRGWADIVRRRVFEPLGMSHTKPVITDALRERTAVGYWPYWQDRPFLPERRLTRAPWVEFAKSSGSISSTPADMALYMTMLLNQGQTQRRRVLSPDAFRLMTTGVQDAASWGKDVKYGYGFAVDPGGGRTTIRHTGGMVAFSSAIHMDLTNGVAGFASVNANLVNYRPNDVVSYALELLRARAAGKELPPIPASDDPKVVNNAADYAGTYSGANGALFTVKADGDRLVILRSVGPPRGSGGGFRGSESVGLLRLGGDRFATDEPGPRDAIQFRRDQAQVVEAFVGTEWFTNERYHGPRTFNYPREWDSYAGHYHNDDPWWGHIRVYLHKGQLWLENADPLTPAAGSLFRVGIEEWSAERVAFDSFANGKPQRMSFSGVDFARIDTP